MSHDTETESARQGRLFLLAVALIIVAATGFLYTYGEWDLSSIAIVVFALLLGALIIGRFLAILSFELR